MDQGIELILGGARSGKSRYALDLAMEFGDAVTWIATAEALDEEMAQRIARHRLERPKGWNTIEAPMELSEALRQSAAPSRCIVVDCLTLWLSNWLCRNDSEAFARERESLLTSIKRVPGPILLVSNEVGWGIVPESMLSRRFRDEAGRLHQELAALSTRVTLVVAGIAMPIKRESSAA
jgi:adenosylcobinamide kinase/adenosylcobinamide-phosphate guanylyltransferase